MQWLRRVKACLSRHEPVNAPESAVRPAQVREGRTLSRVQQNLSWLPVNIEPEPLSAPLPGCPPLMDQDSELRNRYLAYVTHAQEIRPQRMTEADRERGRLLARDCHSRAIDLACAKATEQWIGIYWYMQCAAITALFAEGETSPAFIEYRKDVDHYRDWPLTKVQVWAFNAYVDSIAAKNQSRDFLHQHEAASQRAPSDPVPQPEDMDELLSYLPGLYPNGIAIKPYADPEKSAWPHYVDVVSDFYRVVARDCWTDVEYLSNGARSMLESGPYIDQASLADIQTMLTYCIRGERLSDGHSGLMIERGYVLNILIRLQVLRASLQ